MGCGSSSSLSVGVQTSLGTQGISVADTPGGSASQRPVHGCESLICTTYAREGEGATVLCADPSCFRARGNGILLFPSKCLDSPGVVLTMSSMPNSPL